tara:strand:+ start:24483 stop:25358 length:876 start_codon:yes stop_codon:yes gene_type:complete
MKKRVIIYALSWYGRAIHRKLKKQNKDYDILCFVDADPSKDGAKFSGVPIRSLEYLKNINFDEIYVGGRINKQIIDNLTINFDIPNHKIISYTKNDIKLPKEDLLEKHKCIVNILKNINIASKERNFLYWMDFSSLLAIKRNNLFSEYSDTDIGVISNNHMKRIFLFLSELKENLDIKINISHFNEESNIGKPGEISKITIFNNVNIEDEEPVCIDISRKIFFKNKIYQAYDNGQYFVSDTLFFDGQELVNIFNIEVPIPLSVDKYLASIYGNNWKAPDSNWQVENYANLL